MNRQHNGRVDVLQSEGILPPLINKSRAQYPDNSKLLATWNPSSASERKRSFAPDNFSQVQMQNRIPVKLPASLRDSGMDKRLAQRSPNGSAAHVPESGYENVPLTGIWTETPLSVAYFSRENRQILQNAIRAGVYELSKGEFIIAEQSSEELEVIMRAMFLQYSVNLPDHLTQQIEALNKRVVSYCVPEVYGEAKGRIKYLHDIDTLAVPLAFPVLATNDDTRTHIAKPWF